MLLFGVAFGQENYLPGYVLTLKGDTLKGYIDYREWEKDKKVVFFKKTLDDAKTQYAPLAIKGFGVNEENYESAIVKTEMSTEYTQDLELGSELKIEMDTAFLRAAIRGTKSLYYYTNKRMKVQFYVKQNDDFELLVHKRYLRKTRLANTVSVEDSSLNFDRIIIKENNNFLGQFRLYFADCPKMYSKINSTKYELNKLQKLFYAYLLCSNADITYNEKRSKSKLKFGIFAGVSLTSLNLTGSKYFNDITKAGYKQSTDFAAGVIFDINFLRNSGRWSQSNEILYTTYSVEGRYDVVKSADEYTYTSTSLSYSYIKLNNMVRFKYPMGKLFIFGNAGITSGYAIGEKNYKKIEKKFYVDESVTEGKAIKEARKIEVGFNVGFGAMYKKCSIEFREELGNGMTTTSNLKSITNRIYLLFGYRF
ncbi:MAG TPA: hypothetical protein DIW31_08945 [Bacteroidales bacterium]|nr:hypothetical protein [Bacteroidales bacterium]